MERRARETGFFPDSRDPSSYQTLVQLEYRAAKLLQVEARPASYAGDTAAPSGIMSRGNASGAVPARPAGSIPPTPHASPSSPGRSSSLAQSNRQKHAPPEGNSGAAPDTNDIKTMTFGPIKESKL
jgi:hypothetical protein